MAVSLAKPWFLLLLLPAAALLVLYSGRRRFPASARKLILGLRGFILLLLILALAQPHLVVKERGRSYVFLLDQSLSVGEDYRDWVVESIKKLDPRDRAAVLGFGRDRGLLKPFAMDRLPSLVSQVDGEFSDIAGALVSAYSLLPGSGGRLILISDGLENIGDALGTGEMLAAAGVPVDVVSIPAKAKEDVAVSDISLPKNTWPGQQVLAEVTVAATVATSAQLTVFWGGSLAWRQELEISPGVRSFSVPLAVTGQGLQRVRATVEPLLDAEVRNNSMESLTFVQSPPRILIVEGVSGKGAALGAALAGAGLQADTTPVEGANFNPVALAGYRGVFLVDLPAYKLTPEELDSLETFVRVLGGGLVAVGGKSSFGPGLYEDTPLEEMLPVRMTVESREEIPGMDMVLVIDRSGSMAGEKLNMAKNAAIRALDLLKKDDRLGVVSFDTIAKTELALTPLTEKDNITAVIASIGEGGGTAIHPGLAQAVGMLGKGEKVKHVILLSDGQDGMTYDYTSLLEEARGKGITVSTIALGEGADIRLMENLAAKGNGRSYIVPREQDLPAVFLQETVMAGGEWLVEEDFVPSLLHPDASALANAPSFYGYVASTAKSLAQVLLATHRDHPLLARWQYGLGRTVAFTSDTFGLWSENFLAHPGFASLWADMTNWVLPGGQGTDMALETRLTGAGVEISALLGSPLEEGEKLAVTLVDSEGKTQALELLPAGSGSYKADLEEISQGVYLLSATRQKEGQVVGQAQGGFAVPYPAEFGLQSYSGAGLLAALAKNTGGRVLTNPGEAAAADAAAHRQLTDITWWLLLTAVIAWPLDIALRRLGGIPHSRQKKLAKKEKSQDEKPEDETMKRLLAAKHRRR